MKTKLITIFYIIGLVHHLFIFYYSKLQADFSKVTNPHVLDMQLFTNRYLTSWNMALQTIYFLMALIFEILLIKKEKVSQNVINNFSKIRGYFFTTLLLPSTTVVAFFFWMIYHINRDLILPHGMDEVFPSWVNHSIHTNIIFLPIIELTLQSMYIPSISVSLIGLTIYSHIYNTFYLFTYFETGKWMYPIYYQLSWPQRIALMEVMFVTGVFVCIVGRFIQRLKSEKCDISKADFKTKALNIAKKFL